jgi:hypothetical protein
MGIKAPYIDENGKIHGVPIEHELNLGEDFFAKFGADVTDGGLDNKRASVNYHHNGHSAHIGADENGNWDAAYSIASALGTAGLGPLLGGVAAGAAMEGARRLKKYLQNNAPREFLDKLNYYRDAARQYPFETWSDEAQDDFVQVLDDFINKYRPGHTRWFGHMFEKGGQEDMNSRHREYKKYADERARLRTDPAYNRLNEIMSKNVNDWTEQDYQDAHTLINDLGHSKGKYNAFRRVRRDAELARHREKIAREINPHRDEIYYRDLRRQESEKRARQKAAWALIGYYASQERKKTQENVNQTRQRAKDTLSRYFGKPIEKLDEERLKGESNEDFIKRQELKKKQYEERRAFARSYDPIMTNLSRQAMENSREQSGIEKEINRQRYYQNLWNWGK